MVHNCLSLRILLGAALLLPSAALAAQPAPAPQTATAASIADRLDTYLSEQARLGAFSGAVIVARQSEPVFARAYGLADRQRHIPNTLDTRFNLASFGKRLTSIAILQLAQAGKIGLDDPVGKYLPDFPNQAVREKVTIRQLHDMRSGVGTFWNDKFFADPGRVRTTDDYLALFASEPLAFEPGTSSLYSNGGYIILGKIIESVSGEAFQDYIARHVTGPAGMRDTSFPLVDEKLPHMAVGYTASPAGAGRHGAGGPGSPPPGAIILRPGDPLPPGPPPPGAIILRPGDPLPPGAPPPGAVIIRPGDPVPPGAVLRGPGGPPASGPPGAAVPNGDRLPGRGSSAGGGYSTVGDFLKLDRAIRSHLLLDPQHEALLLGKAYGAGSVNAIGGGYPGANTAMTMFPDGTTIIAFTNMDPPAAQAASAAIADLLGKQLPLMRGGPG